MTVAAHNALVEHEPAPPSASMPLPASETAAVLQIIERAARDPSVDIDKMERLILMQERMQATRAKAAYAAALAEMQPELPVVERRGKITVRAKDAQGQRTGEVQQATPYALWEDINDAIKPILAKHRFALSFKVGQAADGKITVTGILSHAEGHQEETTIVLPHDSTGSKNAVQAVGSTTSYGKRYTAGLLLNFTSRGEDDDGKAGGDEGAITEGQASAIRKLAEEVGADLAKFCAYFKIDAVPDLPAAQFDRAMKSLEKKRAAS